MPGLRISCGWPAFLAQALCFRWKETQMTEPDESVMDYVKGHRLAVLATQKKSGAPQLTMINYVFNGEDYKISVRGFSQKAKNIRKRPEVSMAIVDGRQQVVVYGQCEVVSDFDEVYRLTGELRRSAGAPEQPDAEFRDWLKREERVVLI